MDFGGYLGCSPPPEGIADWPTVLGFVSGTDRLPSLAMLKYGIPNFFKSPCLSTAT